MRWIINYMEISKWKGKRAISNGYIPNWQTNIHTVLFLHFQKNPSFYFRVFACFFLSFPRLMTYLRPRISQDLETSKFESLFGWNCIPSHSKQFDCPKGFLTIGRTGNSPWYFWVLTFTPIFRNSDPSRRKKRRREACWAWLWEQKHWSSFLMYPPLISTLTCNLLPFNFLLSKHSDKRSTESKGGKGQAVF